MTEESKAVARVETNPAPLQNIEIAQPKGSAGQSVTGIETAGEADGILHLSVPNLIPTDNAHEVHEVKIYRLKIPVRIEHVGIEVVDNGYKVRLQNAGRQGMFGPGGAEHVFSGPDAKQKMVEFVAMVVGQVTYQYREVEAGTYMRILRKQQQAARAETLEEKLQYGMLDDEPEPDDCEVDEPMDTGPEVATSGGM